MMPGLTNDESTRYTRRNILRSEWMYGRGFQSPGHLPMMERFCRRLPMASGMSILDIGSGLGGAAFYFAEHFGASVLGLDVAAAMIELSSERAAEQGVTGVQFRRGDIRTVSLPQSAFDLAWTRDCILYVPEKAAVWRQIHGALKPGGHLFITDFCRAATPLSADFSAYLAQCEYHLRTIEDYAADLRAAGFEILTAEDATVDFIACMENEQTNLEASRARFLDVFDLDDYTYLSRRWDKKLDFCRRGEFRWGLFIARKPT
jgi:phosphoethanolamine N-methyltransferase